MRIEKVESGFVSVTLSPADCLMLAEACRWAADNYDAPSKDTNPRANPTTMYIFDTLAGGFDAYAMIADADGFLAEPADRRQPFDLVGIRREWHVPAHLGTAAVGGDR